MLTLSNIEDHASVDQHVHTILQLKRERECAEAEKNSICYYVPIAMALSTLPDLEIARNETTLCKV